MTTRRRRRTCNPATLEALVDQHSEDYCEDVPFAPFIQAWRNDLQRLRVEDEFAANVITEQKHRIASLEAMVEGVRADLAHMLAWSRQSQAALTSRRVADAMMGMCENMLDDLAAQEKRS